MNFQNQRKAQNPQRVGGIPTKKTLNSHTLLVLLITSCHPIPTLGPFPETGGHSGGPLASLFSEGEAHSPRPSPQNCRGL